ncbi:MAG TPA: bifunctional precorrin-2 dehydrogenase/sirohydrochlorin ferrochelatase [Anaeromyxobacteraceae bacterium]|jgi:uroporphyrin-III C-methyltransferase/precorrin-2 dehydrogenase/sirohydrochlorin ferrochelatase|nr:bifunctional precorrin-2 dehydrogenase/sirohydrochlorin ferrochelatase [Anaeromyxobacteraceae bacterium]
MTRATKSAPAAAPELFPAFLKLEGREVLVVGGGAVAAAKATALLASGARVRVVAPELRPELSRDGVEVARRAFEPRDLDGAWLVVAAATPEVNREVARCAEARRVFVNAADDPANASVYLGGVVRRDGVTVAVSTGGRSPALAGLLREALDALLPADLSRWTAEAGRLRDLWRRPGAPPLPERRPLLLQALEKLYPRGADPGPAAATEVQR